MSAVAFAEGENGFALSSTSKNDVVLTINSTTGFMVYKATLSFGASQFQATYGDNGYTNGLKVVDYALADSVAKDEYNAPKVTATVNGDNVTFIVEQTDAACLDLYTQVQIGVRVADGATVALTNVQAADGSKDLDGTLLTFGGVAADGTVDTDSEEYKASGSVEAADPAPTGPVEDATLADTLTSKLLFIGKKFGINVSFYIDQTTYDYDDVEVVFAKKEMDTDIYSYSGEVVSTTFTSADDLSGFAAYGGFEFTYSDIGLYEMNSDVTITLYLKKAGVRTAYCKVADTSLAKSAVEFYKSANCNTQAMKNIVADMLNLGEAARLFFADKGNKACAGTCTLATYSALNTEVASTDGTKDYGTLNTVTGTQDAQFSTPDLMLRSAPSLAFSFFETSCTTPSALTITASYYSLKEGKNMVTTTTADKLSDEELAFATYGGYTYYYDDVALYDANKTITLTVSDGVSTWTYEYSVESKLAEVINTVGLDGDVYRAVACFNASAHAFWPTY